MVKNSDRFGEAVEIHGVELVAHDQGVPVGDGDWRIVLDTKPCV